MVECECGFIIVDWVWWVVPIVIVGVIVMWFGDMYCVCLVLENTGVFFIFGFYWGELVGVSFVV